jgi:hypothetical protein
MRLMKRGHSVSIIGIFFALVAITLGVVFYAQGYRLDFTRGTLEKTGIILAKSTPEGAKVLLDGELAVVTNSSISNLKPGTYNLKIEKEGYFSWEKDTPVKEGFVTDITAILPPLSPSLTAVTQNGAKIVSRAPSGTKAAFVSGDASSEGEAKLFIFNLSSSTLGFLRTTPQKIAEESESLPLSKTTTIHWSPNEDQLLLAVGEEGYYLVSSSGKNDQPISSSDVTTLLETWNQTTADQRKTLIAEAELDQELTTEAAKNTTAWSPDERKFLYEKTVDAKRQLWVVDLSDPLPVGDEEHHLVWETENEQLKLFWLADSHHFVMIEDGTVSLLDLDGSNRRNLFQGTLSENIALSTTNLSKIIVLTAIAPDTPANLYAISLQ